MGNGANCDCGGSNHLSRMKNWRADGIKCGYFELGTSERLWSEPWLVPKKMKSGLNRRRFSSLFSDRARGYTLGREAVRHFGLRFCRWLSQTIRIR